MQQRHVAITLLSPGDSRIEKERLQTLFQLAIAVGRRKGLISEKLTGDDNAKPANDSFVEPPRNGEVQQSLETPLLH